MKKYLFVLILFQAFTGSGQVALYKSSLAPGGGGATAGNTGAVYTVGEIFVSESTNGTVHVSEGFIGPDLTRYLHLEGYGELEGVHIFPNPVGDILSVRTEQTATYEIFLFGLNGKQLYAEDFTGKRMQLDMRKYPPGAYLLVLADRKRKMKVVTKIIKF